MTGLATSGSPSPALLGGEGGRGERSETPLSACCFAEFIDGSETYQEGQQIGGTCSRCNHPAAIDQGEEESN